MADDPLSAARLALDQGDYGQVLRLLEPMVERSSPTSASGANLRLMLATALMGRGDIEKASECCRVLQACHDPLLRSQARNLLQVLEAPPLVRPRDWSITMPRLSGSEVLPGKEVMATRSRRSRQTPPPPPPPVGPTRSPLGFALVVVAFLLMITLLGGCVEVRTDLRFDGPGRLQLSHRLVSSSGQPTPWQRRFEQVLEADSFQRVAEAGVTRWQSSVMPAHEALDLLAGNLATAADLAGVPLPPPRLDFTERNWLLGVHQHLRLEVDLRGLPALQGVDLRLGIEPVGSNAVRRATPLPARPFPAGLMSTSREADPRGGGSGARDPGILWPLQAGQVNAVELRCWRWSPLGLGGVAISLALVMVNVLQRIRLRLGYGLPELPA